MKKKILFVDDEPNILQGLKRMLRGMRREWEMTFAEGGRKALDLLGKKFFDVVVSDIRMPGLDGVELLTETMKRYPNIIRIALSGELEPGLMMKAVRASHQFLLKPCEAAVLKSTVSSGCALSSLVNQMDSIPSLPSLYAELLEEIGSQDVSVQKIGTIISKDIAMTAKILHLVNSPFFGFRSTISSPTQAVALLGLDTIKSLVLSIQIFSRFNVSKKLEAFIETLWEHSMATGILAKTIAEEENQDAVAVDQSFLAGTLHDLGKIVLAANIPDKYVEIAARAERENIPVSEVEMELLGITHSEVGAYLIGFWGLPAPVVEGLSLHHSPGNCLERRFGPLSVVHIANEMEHEIHTETIEESGSRIDFSYLAELDLSDRLPVWEKICRNATQGGADE